MKFFDVSRLVNVWSNSSLGDSCSIYQFYWSTPIFVTVPFLMKLLFLFDKSTSMILEYICIEDRNIQSLSLLDFQMYTAIVSRTQPTSGMHLVKVDKGLYELGYYLIELYKR